MTNDIDKQKKELIRLATQQQMSAADPEKSVWVEASAGTGKTKVLSDRVLRLLLAKVNPAKILCLTYTKAAAVEMNERIAKRLSTWAVEGEEELAAELSAVSADHLLHASDTGIRAMRDAGTVATLLPLTAFALKEPYARGREMIDSGCAVALATDLNPGSCFSGSIPLTFALACIYMHLTIEEAITALTLNGAAALNRADSIGSIEVGKKGDFVVLNSDNYHFLPYYVGMNCVNTTIKEGVIYPVL